MKKKIPYVNKQNMNLKEKEKKMSRKLKFDKIDQWDYIYLCNKKKNVNTICCSRSKGEQKYQEY